MKRMSKKEFDDVFMTCKQQFSFKSEEQIHEALTSFADNNGKISPENIAMFAYVESVNYTNDMLYSVLTKVLDISE